MPRAMYARPGLGSTLMHAYYGEEYRYNQSISAQATLPKTGYTVKQPISDMVYEGKGKTRIATVEDLSPYIYNVGLIGSQNCMQTKQLKLPRAK
uniref:p0432B10.8 protein n=1 Tax=Oryza sativa subsp. japonica TaxID=39947 RepID=Q7F2I0_ORYSJ|nr:P0432B10.8 [Oryza sativa Japonica Group]